MTFAVLRSLGILAVGLLVLAIGAVAGMAYQDRHAPESSTPSAVDIGFAQDMSEHHDQAILMAGMLPDDVAPEIRGLADSMVAAQTAESATMRGWLTWFGLPQVADTPMAWMAAGDGDHADGHAGAMPSGDGSGPPMPGMASTEELQRLGSLWGVEAEVFFLQLMIRHHQGGLEMATATHNDARASGPTKDLALQMIDEQGSEIGRMSMLLLDRGAEPLTE